MGAGASAPPLPASCGGGGWQRLDRGTPRRGRLRRRVCWHATVLPVAVAAPEHGQFPCASSRVAILPPHGAAARDVSRRRAAAAPNSTGAQGSAASCGAEGCLVCGAACMSRAWLLEALSVHAERGSVVGVEGRGRRHCDECCSRRYERSRTADPFVFTNRNPKPIGVGTNVLI